MTLARRRYRPFTRTGRAVLPAILALFVLITGLSIWFSTRTTDRSRNQAAVIEVIARQRTLAERYGKEVLLVRAGEKADPWLTGSVLTRSARALLDGGTAPSMNGDDDDTTVPAISDPAVRGQLVEEARLIKDLTTLGSRLLARPAPTPGSLAAVPQTAGENVRTGDPLLRLQALVALTSNVALNTARNVGAQADRNINQLALMQILLGLGWLLVSLLLAWGLIATIRRQTAHFRSLVTSSSDLVVVLEAGSCRYASRSLCRMVGRAEEDLLGDGLAAFVHPEDREALSSADRWDGKMIMIRVRNAAGEWRHLEARVTDLREDRHLRGIVLNARDVTERIKLERELMVQTQRDAFGTQLGEALEMADEEQDVYEVIERAMTKISDVLPMELWRARVPGAVPLFLCGRATRAARRVRVQRGAQRLPQAPRPGGRRLLGGVRAGELHGARARRGARDGRRGRAAQHRRDCAPGHAGERGRGPDRDGARVRENPAAGRDRLAHRSGQPPHIRARGAHAAQGRPLGVRRGCRP